MVINLLVVELYYDSSGLEPSVGEYLAGVDDEDAVADGARGGELLF